MCLNSNKNFSFGLVIVSQPFPDSVKQHKSIEEPVSVKLITGAKYEARPSCIIKAELITFNSKTKKNPISIENYLICLKKLNKPGKKISFFNIR